MSDRGSGGPVLDASALLAYLQREPGYETVRAALEGTASISTVNLAETYARVVAAGRDVDALATRLPALGLRPEPFTEEDARLSADLFPKTRRGGLSLGDRACLALGLRLGVPVLTADSGWARLKLGVDVKPIR